METRIWCEFTPPEEVCRDYIIDAFKRYNVTLNYKLEYGHDSEGFYNMVRTYNDHHVPLSIWATLSDEMGYWINERNAEPYKPAICRRVIRNEEISELIFGIGKLYYRLR
jgi:hypothetical protein